MLLASIVNGIPSNLIDGSDRGYQFGDGVFETLAIRNGTPCFLGRHLSRLKEGCDRLHIEPVNFMILSDDLLQLAVQYPNAVIKILVTRGSSERGYRFEDHVQPTIVVRVYDILENPKIDQVKGIAVYVCKTKIASQPLLAGIKHMNRLEQVMARNEFNDQVAQEGVLMDAQGHLIEGTMSNLFYCKDDCLITPGLTESGVAGVMRSVVIDAAIAMNIKLSIEVVTMDDLQIADEVFMSNTLMGVLPVFSILGVADYPIGKITRGFQKLLPQWQQEDTSDDWYSK